MNVRELAERIGRKGVCQLGGLTVEVKILDAKMSYGKPRFQITPVAGAGTTWVETVIDKPVIGIPIIGTATVPES